MRLRKLHAEPWVEAALVVRVEASERKKVKQKM